jgi:methylated-DNA-protein-cysteine methyltransferase-like protein
MKSRPLYFRVGKCLEFGANRAIKKDVKEISAFSKKVIKLIQSIPAGKVATYGQIAELAGKPQGSRGVAWILHSSSTAYQLPWHRVLNAQGKISFEIGTHNFRQQKKRLEKEGVDLTVDGRLSLARFQWKKKAPKKRTKAKAQATTPRMFRS